MDGHLPAPRRCVATGTESGLQADSSPHCAQRYWKSAQRPARISSHPVGAAVVRVLRSAARCVPTRCCAHRFAWSSLSWCALRGALFGNIARNTDASGLCWRVVPKSPSHPGMRTTRDVFRLKSVVTPMISLESAGFLDENCPFRRLLSGLIPSVSATAVRTGAAKRTRGRPSRSVPVRSATLGTTSRSHRGGAHRGLRPNRAFRRVRHVDVSEVPTGSGARRARRKGRVRE